MVFQAKKHPMTVGLSFKMTSDINPYLIVFLTPFVLIIVTYFFYKKIWVKKVNLWDDISDDDICTDNKDVIVIAELKPYSHFKKRLNRSDYQIFSLELIDITQAERRFVNRFGGIESYNQWLQNQVEINRWPLDIKEDFTYSIGLEKFKNL